MADELGTLSGKIVLDDKGLSTAVARSTSRLDGFGRQVAGVALGMLGAGGLVMAIQTASRTLKAFLTSEIDVEYRMAQVSTLVDTQVVDMGRLRKGVEDLSKRYGQDAGGLANALYQTISAGVSAGEALQFLEAGTQAAIAGATSTETAVTALVSAYNAFASEALTVKEINDSLFVTIKRGVTTLGELSPIIGRVAPMAAAAGISFDEMNAALSSMTLVGMDTFEAGTALRGMFNALIGPAKEATDVAKKLGIEFSITGVEKAGGLAKWMGILREKTGASVEVLSLMFPEIRALNGVLTLAGSGLENFNSILDDMAVKVGAAEEATIKMEATTKVTWEKMGQTLKSWGRAAADWTILETVQGWSNIFSEAFAPDLIDRTLGKLPTTLEEAEEKMALLTERVNRHYQLMQDPKAATSAEVLAATAYGSVVAYAKARLRWLGEVDAELQKIMRQYERENELRAKIAKEDEERRAKAEELRKKQEEAAKKLLGGLDKEKASKEALAKIEAEREARAGRIVALETESLRALAELRMAGLREQAQAYEADAKKATNSEAQKSNAAINASRVRMEILEVEKQYQLTLLEWRREQREGEAGKDRVELDRIREWYLTASAEIKASWSERVAKELSVSLEAKLRPTTEGMLSRQLEDVFGAFTQRGGKLGKGFTEVADIGMAAVGRIGAAFGTMSTEAVYALEDLATVVEDIIGNETGSWVLTIVDQFLQGLADLFEQSEEETEARRRAQEAERQARMESLRASIESRKAAAAWLKAQGVFDPTVMSFQDLAGLWQQINVEFSQMIAETPYLLRQVIEGGMSYLTVGGEPAATPWWETTSFMNIPELENLRTMARSIYGALSAYSLVPSAEQATTFGGAESAVRAEQERMGYDEEWFARAIMPYVQRFALGMTPEQYQGYYTAGTLAGWTGAVPSFEGMQDYLGWDPRSVYQSSPGTGAWGDYAMGTGQPISADQTFSQIYGGQGGGLNYYGNTGFLSPQFQALLSGQGIRWNGELEVRVRVEVSADSGDPIVFGTAVGEVVGESVSEYMRSSGAI